MARTNECPPYQGFAWDHPLMVHWRKTHPVSPGVGEAILITNFASVLLATGTLFSAYTIIWIIGLSSSPLHLYTYTLCISLVAFSFGLARYTGCYNLEKVSGAKEFDELLEKVVGELTEFTRDALCSQTESMKIGRVLQDATHWKLSRDNTSLCLTKLALRVLEAERANSNDPISRAVIEKKEHFHSAHEAFEDFGLVEGGYGPFFEKAKQQLAKREKLLAGISR